MISMRCFSELVVAFVIHAVAQHRVGSGFVLEEGTAMMRYVGTFSYDAATI